MVSIRHYLCHVTIKFSSCNLSFFFISQVVIHNNATTKKKTELCIQKVTDDWSKMSTELQ